MQYNDSPGNSKLIALTDCCGISRRNVGIFAMWLSGIGIPEAFHEFVTAVFVAGNWDETEEDEITLKRMARAISPGTDADRSIIRAFERLKKVSPKYYEWQSRQTFEAIPREVTGQKRGTRTKYKFPHFKLLSDLFNLPESFTQKQIRAEVSKSLGNLALPPPKERQKKQRKPESAAAACARAAGEVLSLTASTVEAGLLIAEAWRESLGDCVFEDLVKILGND